MQLPNLDNSNNNKPKSILQDQAFVNLLKSKFKLKAPCILRANSDNSKIEDLLITIKNNLK